MTLVWCAGAVAVIALVYALVRGDAPSRWFGADLDDWHRDLPADAKRLRDVAAQEYREQARRIQR